VSDGTGPGLVVNANLIQSNAADSGAGGGIRLQQVNGTEVSSFPNQPQFWNSVSLTNNIIVNNVAGWDGAGISLQDALNVTIQNNTISSNDTLATSGVLTQSIGTPVSSAPTGSCTQTGPSGANTASCPQPAGVSSTPNSSVLTTTFTTLGTLTCPNGTTGCKAFSNPLLQNNVIWQNRSFYIGVGNPNPDLTNQQNQVTLFNASGAAAPTQTAFGQCGTASYWDLGVRGDKWVGTGPNHASGFTLTPTYSVLDDTGYGATNLAVSPNITSQYCNGTRVPPACASHGCGGPTGYGVPPGIVDASAPNPVFTLTPAATVDEGNNWINVSWGPLALSDDSIQGTDGNYGGGNAFGNYALNQNSPAIDYVPVAQNHPVMDFFGNPRPDPSVPNSFDVGAIEYQGVGTAPRPSASVTPSTLAFGTEAVGGTTAFQAITVTNTCNVALAGGSFTFGGGTPQPFSHPTQAGACGATLAVGANCTYNVVFHPTTFGSFSRTLTVAYTGTTVTGSPVTLTGNTPAQGTLTFSSATNGTLGTVAGVRTLTFTIPAKRPAVTSVVTITNSGPAGSSLSITADTLAQFGTLYSITGTTCLTASPLASGATCTVSVQYATPTARPFIADVGALNVANNGTTGPTTSMVLSAQ
jgi:hypothetical protein